MKVPGQMLGGGRRKDDERSHEKDPEEAKPEGDGDGEPARPKAISQALDVPGFEQRLKEALAPTIRASEKGGWTE